MLYSPEPRHLSEPNFKGSTSFPRPCGFFSFFFPPPKRKSESRVCAPAVSLYSTCGPVGLRTVSACQRHNNCVEGDLEQRDIKQGAELENRAELLATAGGVWFGALQLPL